VQVTESQYFIFHANSLSLLPGTDCRLGALRAAKCCFSGTDHRFGALRAAKCCFSGTAADRLSWSAATARRYGGLCAMALLAAAVASRCSESGHGYSGPNDTYAPSVLTSNRLLGAFQLSIRGKEVCLVVGKDGSVGKQRGRTRALSASSR
jgi:hypothetical protein